MTATRTLSEDRQMGHEQLVVEDDEELVIDGDVTLSWDGFTEDRALLEALRIDGTVRFASEGDTLTLDQTAPRLGLHTKLGPGAQFGDGRGTIVFEGEVDLLDVDKSGPGPHFMLFPPEDGTATVNRVAWPHGAGAPIPDDHDCDGEHGSNIGFSGSFWEFTSDVVLRNCVIWGFSHNLFYWYRHYGSLTLENCLIEHSGSRGVSVPRDGLDMSDVTLNIGGKNAYQLFSCGLGVTGFQVETDDGSHREAALENVHVLNRRERCRDGEVARYGVDGSLFGQWYDNGGSFTFELTDCHTELDPASPSHVTVDGDWGTDPRYLGNPLKHPVD